MTTSPGCSACRDGKGLNFPISMAFQPIVDLQRRQIFAHEALVRGSLGESAGILQAYRKQGFMTAIDDFGAGYAGLNLLADFQPDLIKLDMQLIRNIDQDSVRQILVEATLQMCRKLNIRVIAEGIESLAELRTLQAMGVELFQGYLLARPAFESLPEIHLPD